VKVSSPTRSPPVSSCRSKLAGVGVNAGVLCADHPVPPVSRRGDCAPRGSCFFFFLIFFKMVNSAKFCLFHSKITRARKILKIFV
jgi:hypothetical protein